MTIEKYPGEIKEDEHENSIVKMYFAHRAKTIRCIRCNGFLITKLSKSSGYCGHCRRFIKNNPEVPYHLRHGDIH